MVALRSVSCQISDGDMRGTCLVSKTLLLGACDRVCGRRLLEPGLDHGGADGAEGVRHFGWLSALGTTARRLAKSHALPQDGALNHWDRTFIYVGARGGRRLWRSSSLMARPRTFQRAAVTGSPTPRS